MHVYQCGAPATHHAAGLILVKSGSLPRFSLPGMGWVRTFLVAVVLGSWLPIAGACSDGRIVSVQPAATQELATAPEQAECAQVRDCCACPAGLAGPGAAAIETDKSVRVGAATVGAAPWATLSSPALAAGRGADRISAVSRKSSVYLISARLRL